MAFLTVDIGQNKENALRKVLEREPGWNKSLVTRALLTYFLNLTPVEQENLVKTFGVEQKRLIDV
jgi:hypothetical protein